MGKDLTALTSAHLEFIADQKIYFVGTATESSRVNVSPKGMDTLRVLSSSSVAWLNLTGSGNETSAHVQQNPRMTIMFCAVEGSPLILRLYGRADVIHPRDVDWNGLSSRFEPIPGARQIFKLQIELVQTSCGMAVPYFEYRGDRPQLREWAERQGTDGLQDYWIQKNQTSLDGQPTRIVLD